MRPWTIFAAAIAAAFALPCAASGDDLHVSGAWSRELPPVSANGAAYLSIENRGARPVRLIGATSPKARKVQFHEHIHVGAMMQMREIADGVLVAPGETATFEPGGKHVMLMGLTSPLVAGTAFPLRLEFHARPSIDVTVTVRSMNATATKDAGHAAHGATAHGKTRHEGAGKQLPADAPPKRFELALRDGKLAMADTPVYRTGR